MDDIDDIDSGKNISDSLHNEDNSFVYDGFNCKNRNNRVVDDIGTSEHRLVTTSIDMPNLYSNMFDNEFNCDDLFNEESDQVDSTDGPENLVNTDASNINSLNEMELRQSVSNQTGINLLHNDVRSDLGEIVNTNDSINSLNNTNLLAEQASASTDNLDATEVLRESLEDIMTRSGNCDDGRITISDDECEIVQIVGRSPNSNDVMEHVSNGFTGSLLNPISVEDAYDNIVHRNPMQNCNRARGYNMGVNMHGYFGFNNQVTTADDEDCIMGPVHWVSNRKRCFPRDYYNNRVNKHNSDTYKVLDNDVDSGNMMKVLEDVEFLFKCPICYSTITRFRSGRIPNDNDRVIYSTKCGHLFCYECIENVKSRRECSICRKPIKDQSQYHVVFP